MVQPEESRHFQAGESAIPLLLLSPAPHASAGFGKPNICLSSSLARSFGCFNLQVPKAWLEKLDALVSAAGGKPIDSENRLGLTPNSS